MTTQKFQTIELHEQAPPKPSLGTPCNECGVCYAVEPCPVAYIFLFQRKRRCRALLWQKERPLCLWHGDATRLLFTPDSKDHQTLDENFHCHTNCRAIRISRLVHLGQA